MPAPKIMNAALPPSFGDNPWLYAWALGSVSAIAILMMMIAGWMARDIWRDRYHLPPTNTLMLVRTVLMFAAATSVLRNLPEAVMLYSWNEVDEQTMGLILLLKRFADGVAIAPATIWTVLFTLAYPSIAMGLRADISYSLYSAWAPWPKLVRPAFALILVFAIAFLVAISKVYLGVPSE